MTDETHTSETEEATVDVVCPVDGHPVFVEGFGIVRPSGHPHAVPDSDDVRFLLQTGTLVEPPYEAPPTLAELRERAGELDIDGRSRMNREQLTDAIARAEAGGATTTPQED